MSEINDALKRARQATSSAAPKPLAPLPLATNDSTSSLGWVIPAFIVVLILAAICFIGWALERRPARHEIIKAETPSTVSASVKIPPAQAEAVLSAPISNPPAAIAATPPIAVVVATVAPKVLPKLQGIFYSPTAPTAILDGKTIAPGDQFGEYRVHEISKEAVTLADASGKEIKISISH